MRIVLELTNGPEKGRKIRLGANQTVTVGRTEWSDFVVESDQRLSSKHFVLETDREGCQLRDLGSANGTRLNGAPAKVVILNNQDKISAGDSQFVVHIESAGGRTENLGGSPLASLASPRTVASAVFEDPRSKAPAPRIAPAAPAAEISVQTTPSGLYQARCLKAQLPPIQLAERLARSYALHAIVDFGRLGQPRPDSLPAAALFDWLPLQSAAPTPVVVSPCELSTLGPWLETGWGLDAIVCLFSNEAPDALLSHLRTEARAAHNAVMGYCWPSVLGPLLTNFRPARVARLMAKMDLVLCEDQDEPEKWQVFSVINLKNVFEKLGLRISAPSGAIAGG